MTNKIGLTQQTLFEIGITEHLTCIGEALDSIMQDKELSHSVSIMSAEREAILKSVAKMIEENNKVLLAQLNPKD